MGKETIIMRIKGIVYKIILPIYLWSIGMKTLKEYISKIEREYEAFKKHE